MSDAIIGLLGAMVGGAAALAGAVMQARAAERAEIRRGENAAREAREDAERRASDLFHALAQSYLFQLQEAVESLRHRIHNWADRGGPRWAESKDPGYWEITTLYALGRALGAERVLALEGVYLALERVGRVLAPRQVEDAVQQAMRPNVFFYHRLTLAESVLDRGPDGFRLLTYTEFRHRYEDARWGLQPGLKPITDALARLRREELSSFEEALGEIGGRLSTCLGNGPATNGA
jgi:hypothetical protein